MRFLLFLSLSIMFLAPQAEARNYKGGQDVSATGNPIGPAYEVMTTFPRQVIRIACIALGVDQSVYISYTGSKSDCSDASDDIPIPGGGSFVLEEDDIGRAICAKTVGAVATTTGLIHCRGWWRGESQ
jgi:hypothetical protein